MCYPGQYLAAFVRFFITLQLHIFIFDAVVDAEGIAAESGELCTLAIPEEIDYFRPEWGLRGPHLASKRSVLRSLLDGMKLSGVVWYDGFVLDSFDDDFYDERRNNFRNVTDPCRRFLCTDLEPNEYPERYRSCTNVMSCNGLIRGVNYDILKQLESRGNFTVVLTVLAKPLDFWVFPNGNSMSSMDRIKEQSLDFDIALDTWYEADLRRYGMYRNFCLQDHLIMTCFSLRNVLFVIEGVYFGRGFQDTSMIILSPKPESIPIGLGVLWEPFTAQLWIVSAVLFGFGIITISLSEYGTVVREQKKGDLRFHVMGLDFKSLLLAAGRLKTAIESLLIF